MRIFIATLWVCLFAAWMYSGEQMLDLAFGMPDLGPIDDAVINGVVMAEDARAAVAPPDYFSALRGWMHSWTGLN